MISSWTDCAGRSVGRWKLDSLLGERDETAYYIGKEEETGASALIHLVEAERESWALAKTLDHPHVLRVYDRGDTYFDLTRVEYAATEIPDDDLGEMLSRGPLDKAAARNISGQAAQGLEFLHQHGLCHGGVSPSTIFLVGDQVKLGVDTLQRATETCRARDLQQLWEIFPVEAPQEEPEHPVAPVASDTPVRPRARLPWPVVGVAAGAVLALLIGYRSMHTTSTPAAAPVAVAPAPVEASAPPAPKPAPFKPSPTQTRSREAKPAYAVVAATYANYVSAEIRAKKLNQQARLKAHVFPQEGKGSLYYVVLGSGMSQKDAEKLRRTARDQGAPRDTYVTKLVER